MKKQLLVLLAIVFFVVPTFATNRSAEGPSPESAPVSKVASGQATQEPSGKEDGSKVVEKSGKSVPSVSKDESKARSQSDRPGRRGFPTFQEKPWIYIVSGVVFVLIITLYLVHGGGGSY